RLDYQKELVPSFAAAAGSFAGSLVLCGVIMMLMNLVLNGSLQSAHLASAMRMSPIGPSFSWNPDVAPQRKVPREESGDEPASNQPAQNNQKKIAAGPTTAPADGSLFGDASTASH